MEELAELSEQGRIAEALIPAADLLPEFPSEWSTLLPPDLFGRAGISEFPRFSPSWLSKYIKAVSQDGELLAIGEAKLPNVYHPILVF